MTAPRATIARPADGEAHRLGQWLLCWILLPNLGFWLMWIIGGPPRAAEILATGVAGLLVRKRPFAVKLTVFLLLLGYSVLSFIASLFNLAILSLLASVESLADMRPGTSIEYLIAGFALLVTIAIAARVLRARTDFTRTWGLLVAAGVLVGVAALDRMVSFGGAYGRSAARGAPFASAVTSSGFAARPEDKRHLVLIMVESLGLPSQPAMRRKFAGLWERPDIAALYEVRHGSTPYFGSTTSGEIRELCGRWGDYYALVDTPDSRCLPARLAAAGYDTTAIHSFEGGYFKRDRWYPNIGFGKMVFRDALMAEGAKGCPGVFPGACDRDVPAILADRLRKADRPQFVYWLTVNSHLPVPTDDSLGTRRCSPGEFGPIGEFGMICRQFQLWRQLSDRLAAQLASPDFPDADILLVGDHMPPYFDRRQRSQFDGANVPWILLRRKPHQ